MSLSKSNTSTESSVLTVAASTETQERIPTPDKPVSKPIVQEQQEIKQTPINNIHNVDVLNFMRKDYSSVVEVGSSSGALARVYREQNPKCRYVGIEIDAE